jgi:hypothetical protein
MEPEFAPVGIPIGTGADVSRPDFVAYRCAPSEAPRTLLPVRLFGVQEESLVEAANRNECFAAKEQYSSDGKVPTASQDAKTDRLNPRAEGSREWPRHAVFSARAVLPLRGRYTSEPRIIGEA